jgi:hypothetical protein
LESNVWSGRFRPQQASQRVPGAAAPPAPAQAGGGPAAAQAGRVGCLRPRPVAEPLGCPRRRPGQHPRCRAFVGARMPPRRRQPPHGRRQLATWRLVTVLFVGLLLWAAAAAGPGRPLWTPCKWAGELRPRVQPGRQRKCCVGSLVVRCREQSIWPPCRSRPAMQLENASAASSLARRVGAARRRRQQQLQGCGNGCAHRCAPAAVSPPGINTAKTLRSCPFFALRFVLCTPGPLSVSASLCEESQKPRWHIPQSARTCVGAQGLTLSGARLTSF